MKSIINKPTFDLKAILAGAFVVLLLLAGSATPAMAQTYTQTYQPRTTEELISYLYGIIAQLQAQLALRRGQPTNTSATVTTYGSAFQSGYGYANTDGYYYGTGQVLGTSDSIYYNNPYNNYYYNSSASYTGTPGTYSQTDLLRYYRVKVDRPSVSNLDVGEATFRSMVTFEGAPYVDVWFDYGPDGYVDDRTRSVRLYSNGARERDFWIRVDDLDEDDESYYVRAVAEEPNGDRVRSQLRHFEAETRHRSSRYDDEPDADTDAADDIETHSAVLRGDVDMNDFDDGLVFFVYGEDDNQVEDIEDDYDQYSDIDEDGDDLQKVKVDSSLDGHDSYRLRVTNLDSNTDIYFQICVEFEDDDNDEVITCGGVEDFETD